MSKSISINIHTNTVINKDGYFLDINDCVSYADDVEDEIKLNTPDVIDVTLTPMGFINYLIDNN